MRAGVRAASREKAAESASDRSFTGDTSLNWDVVMGSAEDVQTAAAMVNGAVSAFQGTGTL
jgi:hypothetical protein